MLKNKYASYLLGALVLFIWGTIFYKIYTSIKGVDDVELPMPNFFASNNGALTEEEYSLLADYKDPFLGKAGFGYGLSTKTRPSNANPSGRNVPATRPVNPPPKKPVNPPLKEPVPIVEPLPEVIYQGYQILQADTVAILKINKQFIPNARKGEVRQAVRIEAIYRDSIQLSFKGLSWTVLR
jgi:hypothetical protein